MLLVVNGFYLDKSVLPYRVLIVIPTSASHATTDTKLLQNFK